MCRFTYLDGQICPMIVQTPKRITTKITILLLVAGIVGAIIATATTFYLVRSMGQNAEKEEMNLILNSIEPTVSVSLFLGISNLDDKLIPITQNKEVARLSVHDKSGFTLYDYQAPYFDQDNTIVMNRTLNEPSSSRPIGTITLYFSTDEFDKIMGRFYLFYGAMFLFFTFLLFALLHWMKQLLSPIQIIAQKVHQFRPGEKIAFDIDASEEEIVQITGAFEAMQERVWEYANKFQTINQSLATKIEEQTQIALQRLYFDPLTQLPNRLKLQNDLKEAPCNTIALFNIDDFKEINDFFGIAQGDALLKQIASWLQEMQLEPYRMGGDEFAFQIKSNETEDQFVHNIETLLSLLSEKAFLINNEILHLHATVGIASQSNHPLIHADIALNEARIRKLPFALYDSSVGIEEKYQQNLSLSAKIRQALIEHRIVCQYQPIVSTQTGKIIKYETLVRLQDDNALIPPNVFLPIAKKTKLYHHITQEVIYQACHLFANRSEEFSVNLSSADMLDSETVRMIERTLTSTNTGRRIIFEILESEGIENFEEVAAFITRVKALGAKIAIDDFGTGYSNYENILKLNVDFLKIDGSLIKSIDTQPRHKIVVEAIVDFANRIGVETVAEFVASQEVLETIKSIGITYSQGFHTGKPQFLG